MIFRVSNKIVVAILSIIWMVLPCNGQSIEEMEETVGDLTGAVGLLKGDISSIFSVSDFFTSSAKDEYKNKLQELTSIKFNRTANEASKWIKKNNVTVLSLENEKFWQKDNPSWNRRITPSDVTFRRIGDLGDGKSKEKIIAYKNNQLTAIRNLTVEEAFPVGVRNIILDKLSSDERNVLNRDIKNSPIMINFFSKYPEAIDTYKKLIESDYRKDLSFLYFWTYDFLTNNSGLNKNEIIEPQSINFKEYGNNRLAIIYKDRALATISMNKMEVIDPIMLNYALPPNHTIYFQNLAFRTDNLKRVASIQVRVAPKTEKKVKIQKSKTYDIKKFNKNLHSNYSYLVTEKANGYKVLQNAFKLDEKKCKRLLKYIEKSYAIAQKEGKNNSMSYDFHYESGRYEPSYVEVGLVTPIETKKQTYGKLIKLDLR